MKSFIPAILLGLVTLVSADTTPTDTSIPKSTDASSFLSEVYEGEATPTWATGKYATTLASALYSAQTSFAMRSDYRDIVEAIWSAADKDGGSSVVESLSESFWNWGAVTTNNWFQDNVPKSLQTAVAQYDDTWESVFTSVEAKATGTQNAAAPRCTGMAVAGVAALGVAAVAGAM
ncbi:hypothetical protein N8I77_010109 [Diaporthe amygdali]|uniref:Uncharacterized protein n=1 Tax=Phomopsis amygdali TaxID=1214568 RepID=A0AAD9S696_PHOAM|nr:uncharacterized protein J7T55_011490 [Diaporthe amygdali]KAJ0123028.1 hypothetical protein J7T55_011490 [Diaporthe amygdali]KAK2600587.1 hypothetical protein N8I77_010109 [Diaporthe amygdali]